MKENIIVLTVEFDVKQKQTLYGGKIWYRDNLIDTLKVTSDRIELTCKRSKKADENFLLSPMSPARNELYRAAVFYLSVMGEFPKIKTVSMKHNGVEIEVDKNRLFQYWDKCRMDIVLDKRTASRCFSKEGKRCYIAMTYFVRAQMGSFSNDRFRAAWSGLNVLYYPLVGQYENNKLQSLGAHIREEGLMRTEQYLEETSTTLWKSLQWHNLIQNAQRGKYKKGLAEQLIRDDDYQDIEVYSHLSQYLLEQKVRFDKQKVKGKNKPIINDEQFENLSECLDKVSKQHKIDYRVQASFLVTEYCYTMRNRAFHGERPYPIFRMKNEKEELEEKQLTNILLYTISDLLDNYDVLKEKYVIKPI